jgi:phospholipid/cholesterol/gamma-HCH transport system substrate-binding protein
MILRRVKIQLAVFAVIAFVGVVYVGGRYAGLGTLLPGYDPGYIVKADFADSGGIFEGAEVTYRGVPVGKVEDLELREDGIRVNLRIKPGTRVPTPTKAFVNNRSAVGEQYVDLQPTVEGPTMLKQGDVIPQRMTGIPIQPTQLVVNLDRFVRSIDTADVTVVLEELGKAFEGSGDDLQRLVDAGDLLTKAATDNLPQTLKLIRDSEPVLNTQRDTAEEFRSYNASLAQLSKQLRASDPDFRALFKSGTDSARATTSLLEANRTNLPILLQNLVFFAQVQKVRIPALRQILVTYPNVVAGGYTVTPGDGTAHFGFVNSFDAPPCPSTDPGYAPTVQRDPRDITAKTPRYSANCSRKSPTNPSTVRGARNAPYASDQPQPFPQNRSAANQAALFSGMSSTDDYSDGFTAELADYDPATGQAMTATGQPFVIGSGGGEGAFGNLSWISVLLDPLRP